MPYMRSRKASKRTAISDGQTQIGPDAVFAADFGRGEASVAVGVRLRVRARNCCGVGSDSGVAIGGRGFAAGAARFDAVGFDAADFDAFEGLFRDAMFYNTSAVRVDFHKTSNKRDP